MKKYWEHNIIEVGEDFSKILYSLGSIGWELATIYDGFAYLKRELSADDLRLRYEIIKHSHNQPIPAAKAIKKGDRVVYFEGRYHPADDAILGNTRLPTQFAPYEYAVSDYVAGEIVQTVISPHDLKIVDETENHSQ